MRKLLKEPLLHFLVLGVMLFGVNALIARRRGPTVPRDGIVVTQQRMHGMAEGFARTWQRPPTDEEMAGLVRDHLREEVLAREAVALGLDRDDTIVRRRLAQKMDFLMEDVATPVEPTDAELADHLRRHADSFRTESRLTFSQILLDPQRRGAALEADAARLLAELNAAGASLDPAALGDSRLLDAHVTGAPQRDVAAQFGESFAAALVAMPVDRWRGPVASGFGMHLVRIEAREQGRLPDLDEVRDAVVRDWSAARRTALKSARLDALLAKYEITIEPAAPVVISGGSVEGR